MNHQDISAIKNHMEVVTSDSTLLGIVDHVDANQTLKLTKDRQGQHHWIPLDWVEDINTRVHLDRSSQQAHQHWMTTPPKGAKG